MRIVTAGLRFAFAGFATLLASPSADAGWVTIRNDTQIAIAVSDSGKNKPVTIQPGESYRVYQTTAGTKNVIVSNAQKPNNPILTGRLSWATDDVRYTIRTEGSTLKLIQDPIPKK